MQTEKQTEEEMDRCCGGGFKEDENQQMERVTKTNVILFFGDQGTTWLVSK